MEDKKYIEIRRGAIRIRDPGTAVAIGALRGVLALHAAGIFAVFLIAGRYGAFNSWLIFAVLLFAVGILATACSLASVLRLCAGMNDSLRRTWDQYGKGKFALDELLPHVEQLCPKSFDPGPAFGWLSGCFCAGGGFAMAVGLAKVLETVAKG
jgi:hypothetical protein